MSAIFDAFPFAPGDPIGSLFGKDKPKTPVATSAPAAADANDRRRMIAQQPTTAQPVSSTVSPAPSILTG